MSDGTAAPATELADRISTQSAIASALIELEGHPAHDLLSRAAPDGDTGRRWAVAREQLARLWQDFAAYQSVVTQACSAAGPAQIDRLLRGPSVEIRTDEPASMLGPQVHRITLDELTERMDRAFGEVRAVLITGHDLHEAFLARMSALAERLRDARRLAGELGAEPESVRAAALTRKLQQLDTQATADPLALGAHPLTDELAPEIETLAARLAAADAVRAGWAGQRAEVLTAVYAVATLRADTQQVRERAADLILGPVPPLPPDHAAELTSRRTALERGSWPTRATALAELRAAAAAASAELAEARDLAAGLIERRAELRGRFEAYRAKAVRLGRAEDPELLALDGELRAVLWSKPCDLAAATRTLGAYQRELGRPR